MASKLILDDRYEIYENGDLYRVKPRLLVKPHIITQGYKRVNVKLQMGVPRKYLVHRLVAETFIENPNNLDTVDHIDGDKLNNDVHNLQWLSNGDNKRKSSAKGGRVRSPQGTIHEYDCLSVFCREHNLHQGNFGQMTLGKIPHAQGWTL